VFGDRHFYPTYVEEWGDRLLSSYLEQTRVVTTWTEPYRKNYVLKTIENYLEQTRGVTTWTDTYRKNYILKL
jgi:hypothetical protein